jgi:hypothetical protein
MPPVNSEIFLSNSNITSIKLGNTSVSKVFLGEDLVFGSVTPTPTPTATPTPTQSLTPTNTATPTPTPTPPVTVGTQGFGTLGTTIIDTDNITTATVFTLNNVQSTASQSGYFVGLPTNSNIGNWSFDTNVGTSLSFTNIALGTFQSTIITTTSITDTPGRQRTFSIFGSFTGGTNRGNTTPNPTTASITLTLTQSGAAISSSAILSIPVLVPGPVTILTANPGSDEISITWAEPDNGGSPVLDYSISVRTQGSSSIRLVSGSLTSFTIPNLLGDREYTIAMQARNAVGTGPWGPDIVVTTTVSATPTPTPTATPTPTPSALSFTPMAVMLTSGTSYTVPAGATSVKAWAIGSGGTAETGRAGGGGGFVYVNSAGNSGAVAYKTWPITGGSISYGVGAAVSSSGGAGNATTVTYGGVTIVANGGTYNMGTTSGSPRVPNNYVGATFSGGDGGAIGARYEGDSAGALAGGGVPTICARKPALDVDGLFAALALAGVSTSETCGETAAFGSGAAGGKYTALKTAGLGGGGIRQDIYTNGTPSGAGAVVLLFS